MIPMVEITVSQRPTLQGLHDQVAELQELVLALLLDAHLDAAAVEEWKGSLARAKAALDESRRELG